MKMNRGEGTLGKLMTDTSMYHQLTDLSRSLKEFLDDLKKHPGKIRSRSRSSKDRRTERPKDLRVGP
jgi:hypothetical protein